MTDKQLKDKAIQIKGKDYVLVSDRVLFFNETYENGCIYTELLQNEESVTIKATVIPDCTTPERKFIGHAQETWGDGFINKTSALENAETSAVGRALALMGIGVIDSIASVDEINKAKNRSKKPTKPVFTQDKFDKWVAQDELMPLSELEKHYTINSEMKKDIQDALDQAKAGVI